MRAIGSGVFGALLAAAAASPGLAGPGYPPLDGLARHPAGIRAPLLRAPALVHPGRGGAWVGRPARAHDPRARAARLARAPRLPAAGLVVYGGALAAGYGAPCSPEPVLVEEWCGMPPGRIVYGSGPTYSRPLYNRPDPFE